MQLWRFCMAVTAWFTDPTSKYLPTRSLEVFALGRRPTPSPVLGGSVSNCSTALTYLVIWPARPFCDINDNSS